MGKINDRIIQQVDQGLVSWEDIYEGAYDSFPDTCNEIVENIKQEEKNAYMVNALKDIKNKAILETVISDLKVKVDLLKQVLKNLEGDSHGR